jgi:hypothetical protein
LGLAKPKLRVGLGWVTVCWEVKSQVRRLESLYFERTFATSYLLIISYLITTVRGWSITSPECFLNFSVRPIEADSTGVRGL